MRVSGVHLQRRRRAPRSHQPSPCYLQHARALVGGILRVVWGAHFEHPWPGIFKIDVDKMRWHRTCLKTIFIKPAFYGRRSPESRLSRALVCVRALLDMALHSPNTPKKTAQKKIKKDDLFYCAKILALLECF